MPIWLKNLQRKVLFNDNFLRLQAEFLLNLLGAGRFDVSVVCVGSTEIQHLNKVYRNTDSPTDILSFQYHEGLTPGRLPEMDCDSRERNLGDLILGMSVIDKVCRSERVKLENRLPVIITHGLCHLIGHRHGNKQEREEMYRAEKSLLIAYGNSFGVQLTPLTE